MGSQKQVINQEVLLHSSVSEIQGSINKKTFLKEGFRNKSLELTAKMVQEAFLMLTGIGIAVLLILSIF